MLRISTIEAAGETVTLKIDGQVSGQWVKLLQKTCEDHLEKGLRLTIDLRNVSFVDREGIALLRSLTECRVELMNLLPFIAEQIRKAAPR
jgi:anti-anti-sigma regulatory factor